MTLPAMLLSLALSAAAQTTEPARAPAVRETPPEPKAYTEASRISDPQKKIEALEKFKRDFPASVFPADQAILSTLVKSFPDSKRAPRPGSATPSIWMRRRRARAL
jgi:hypothetical protein